MEKILGGDFSNSGKIDKSKLPKLWLVHNPEPLVEVYFNNYRFCLFCSGIYFHEWALLSLIRKFFKQIYLYTILIQGMNIIFIDQIPIYLF